MTAHDTMRERIMKAILRADIEWHTCELGKYLDEHMADAVLAVLANPTDEDVERAAEANCEAAPEAIPWADLHEVYQRELRVATRATIHAYLGGDEA